MLTSHQAKYFAHSLSYHDAEGIGRLSQSLFDAQVDLNPHQIEAALFALQSPLSKGVILADEVGLGKTIEAGIILCQLWAEKKRRILIVCPASIRKQWALELEEKFNLPATVFDAKEYKKRLKAGNPRPFDSKEIIICSYPFASRHKEEIRSIPFDLAAIDEAHKLKNCYRPSNKMGKGIRWALEERKKILLTATPLQNSLLEIYGLSTFIDEDLFGDVNAFRSQFMRMGGDLGLLRQRLGYFCKRTLRKDVTEYINYTDRKALTQPFIPTDEEQSFYDNVSTFIQRDDLYSIPQQRRHLIVLILRKLLASSSEAIIATLQNMLRRLFDIRDGKVDGVSLIDDLLLDDDFDPELLDELLDEVEESVAKQENQSLPEVSITSLLEEIKDLEKLINQGLRIGIETKTEALSSALEVGFQKMQDTGAAERALIFTESRRTQDALKLYLEENGYRGKVIIFNGSNNTPESKAIYEQWLVTNAGNGKSSGSRPIDIRTALIDHFRDHGTILIATEAAAEGVNMQFCSLLINFDLPWNPQRVEQRIGRCHRYGQKHDVVVINFINSRNAADQRVHQLLTEKFKLFDSVFGASDEVLGSIESGVDFEKRVLKIYQTCRTPDQIETAFNQLQQELKESIDSRLADTEKKLLDHFDEDVHQRLKMELAEAHLRLDKLARQFWLLSKHMIAGQADWQDDTLSFHLNTSPIPEAPRGRYHLISKNSTTNKPSFTEGYLYRLSHPLGEHVIQQGKETSTPHASLTFDTQTHPGKITLIEQLRGTTGHLRLTHLQIQSYEEENYLLFSAHSSQGTSLDQETCEKLLTVLASVSNHSPEIPEADLSRLTEETQRHTEATISTSLTRNHAHFKKACENIDRWADDMVIAAEQKLQLAKAEIRALRTQMRQAPTLEEQRDIQEQVRDAERRKRKARNSIDEVEESVEEKRESLIIQLEQRLVQKTTSEELFTIHFSIL
jgi:superfamily II DNA/RNA helicase